MDIERISDERIGFARADRAAKQDDVRSKVRQWRHAHRRDGDLDLEKDAKNNKKKKKG